MLLVIFDMSPQQATMQVDFLVVKILMPCNVILHQPSLYAFDVVIFIKYLLMKFPTKNGNRRIRGNWAMV